VTTLAARSANKHGNAVFPNGLATLPSKSG
jgi:hypothetical protein